jgi:hypothetical protein
MFRDEIIRWEMDNRGGKYCADDESGWLFLGRDPVYPSPSFSGHDSGSVLY